MFCLNNLDRVFYTQKRLVEVKKHYLVIVKVSTVGENVVH